jgi:hypothetical protein
VTVSNKEKGFLSMLTSQYHQSIFALHKSTSIKYIAQAQDAALFHLNFCWNVTANFRLQLLCWVPHFGAFFARCCCYKKRSKLCLQKLLCSGVKMLVISTSGISMSVYLGKSLSTISTQSCWILGVTENKMEKELLHFQFSLTKEHFPIILGLKTLPTH